MKIAKIFLGSLIIFCLLLSGFSYIVSSGSYNIIDPNNYEDPNSKWINEPNAYDNNVLTYAEGIELYYMNYTKSNFYGGLKGVRVNCVEQGLSSYDPYIYLDYYDTYTSSWINIYEGYVTKNTYVYKNLTDIFCIEYESAILLKVRIKVDLKETRTKFYLKEIDFVQWYNNEPSILPAYSEYPAELGSGSGCYGLYPNFYITCKDNNNNDDLTLIFLSNVTGTWIEYYNVTETSSSSSFIIMNENFSIFNKYGIKYYYNITYYDNDNNCYNIIRETKRWFIIEPCVLDYEDVNDTLPNITGLNNPDCWELVSIPCNVSKYDVLIYNTSTHIYRSWNYSTANNIIYNGLFWYNSTSNTYNNVTTFQIFKGYWIYFYIKNYVVRYNCSCEYNCSGIVWVNYSDSNITFNISVDKATDMNTSSYSINLTNWLYIGVGSMVDVVLNIDMELLFTLLLMIGWIVFTVLFFKNRFTKNSIILGFLQFCFAMPLTFVVGSLSTGFILGYAIVFIIPVLSILILAIGFFDRKGR